MRRRSSSCSGEHDWRRTSGIDGGHMYDEVLLSPEPAEDNESDLLAELTYINNRYLEEKREIVELQKARELFKVDIKALRKENVELKNRTKSLGKSLEGVETLRHEKEEVRQSQEERDKRSSQLETQRKRLEEQVNALEDQRYNLSEELYLLKSEIEQDQRKILELNRYSGEMQYLVELDRITLLQKNELIQTKELVIEETQGTLAEYSLIINYLKAETEYFSESQKTVPSLAEEMKVAILSSDVEKPKKDYVTVEVEVASSPAPKKSSLGRSFLGGLKQMVYDAGIIALKLMVPLCVMATCAPNFHNVPGVASGDLLQDAANNIINRYCTLEYLVPPPF